MTNIIDLSRALKEKKPIDWFKRGREILSGLNKQDAEAVIDFMRTYSLYEIRISKGLVEVDMSVLSNDNNFRFADQVQEIYDEAAGGCYFCTDNDPNAVEYNESTYLCLGCQIKAIKMLNHYGLKH